jgi:hypothetical protein
MLSAITTDDENVGLLRDSTEALVGTLTIVVGGVWHGIDSPMQ